MEEVERSLVRVEGQQRRLESLRTTLQHREYAYELAQKSYRLGEANLNEVLDAQRNSLRARQQALQGRTALATSQVALFVALGGGWEMDPGAVQGIEPASATPDSNRVESQR